MTEVSSLGVHGSELPLSPVGMHQTSGWTVGSTVWPLWHVTHVYVVSLSVCASFLSNECPLLCFCGCLSSICDHLAALRGHFSECLSCSCLVVVLWLSGNIFHLRIHFGSLLSLFWKSFMVNPYFFWIFLYLSNFCEIFYSSLFHVYSRYFGVFFCRHFLSFVAILRLDAIILHLFELIRGSFCTDVQAVHQSK